MRNNKSSILLHQYHICVCAESTCAEGDRVLKVRQLPCTLHHPGGCCGSGASSWNHKAWRWSSIPPDNRLPCQNSPPLLPMYPLTGIADSRVASGHMTHPSRNNFTSSFPGQPSITITRNSCICLCAVCVCSSPLYVLSSAFSVLFLLYRCHCCLFGGRLWVSAKPQKTILTATIEWHRLFIRSQKTILI